MPLDPQVKALLDGMAALGAPPIHSLPPEHARLALKMMRAPSVEETPVAKVENRTIPGPAGEIPVRIYTPEGGGPFPTLVFYHGGGWVIGDLDTHDPLCRNLTKGASCLTVSVDYRLAPEAKFPAAVDDSVAALQWVAAHASELGGDGARLAIGGDSAGGNLAAVAAQVAKQRGGPALRFQLLIYPPTDFTAQTASSKENADGYFLTYEDMVWFRDHYLNSLDDRVNPLASPMLARDVSGLPPALIITGEFDPLRDEGELYGAKLRAAGVPVTISRYDGMIHGFLSFANAIEGGRRGVDEASAALRAALA
jgi:acetyl esterase